MDLFARWAGTYTESAVSRHQNARGPEAPVSTPTQGLLGFADDNKCSQHPVYPAAELCWAI